MPGTAVAIVYSSEGFALSADGKETERECGNIVTLAARKIFPIKGKQRKLAWALIGTRLLVHPVTDAKFDIETQVKHAVHNLARKRPAGIAGYSAQVARRVYQALNKAKSLRTIKDYPDLDGHGTIALVYFAGFYEGVPSVARIRLSHKNQMLVLPHPWPMQAYPGCEPFFLGSSRVAQILLRGERSPLSEYSTPVFKKLSRHEDVTLAEAIEAATSYIRACCDPRAVRIDKYCEFVGGRIRAATITNTEGFQRVEGMESVEL